MPIQQKVTPFLTFDSRAEEAANLYVSIFKNSKVNKVVRAPEGLHMPAGTAMTVAFELDGLHFTALNAGPMFKFSEAISLAVDCETQAEVDHFWNALTADGGEPSHCGWLKDKFGVSWQITPRRLIELISSSDQAVAGRAMQAMMQMRKIDIATIEAAAAGN